MAEMKVAEMKVAELNKKFAERTWSSFSESETSESRKTTDPTEDFDEDIRVVVGLDFGTTFSGFTYYHAADVKKEKPFVNDDWHGEVQLKTNTVLQYDDEFINVRSWGIPALAKKPSRRNRDVGNKPVELFKLHLGDLPDNKKPPLPAELDCKKAITDYLREIGKVIKEKIERKWPRAKVPENALLVITVPAEYSDKARAIMRECAHNAGLIEDRYSTKLQFTTEPEAAAVYCMEKCLEEQALSEPGTAFMIVDCGGGTVDLTTRELLRDNQLGEITERSGDFCGSTYVDAEFINYLRRIIGDGPMDSLRDNYYGQMQYMIQHFCRHCKIPFTGEDPDITYELDIQDIVPILKESDVTTDVAIRNKLDEDDWVIEIDFENIKLMFEPVVKNIIGMIKAQLDNSKEKAKLDKSNKKCSAMFMVGGFSESKYLKRRIKQEFGDLVDNISVPTQPISAVSHGAAIYGLSIKNNLGDENFGNMKCVISSRVLNYTYGIEVRNEWTERDPIHRKGFDGRVVKFECLARRSTQMGFNQEATGSFAPVYPIQKKAVFNIYCTRESYPTYIDEPGMKLLGKLTINLPGTGLDRPVLFGLAFGQMEITATAKNKNTGQNYKAAFKYAS